MFSKILPPIHHGRDIYLGRPLDDHVEFDGASAQFPVADFTVWRWAVGARLDDQTPEVLFLWLF